jgi:hypothetical protein
MAYVYIHKRLDNHEVFYVGIGSDNTFRRAYDKTQRGKHWKDMTKRRPFTVTITHTDIIWEEACAIEQYLIAFYGRKDLGLGSLVNKTDGGDGPYGAIVTQETREKLSRKLKGKRPWCEGQKLSEETRRRMSAARTGRVTTEEAKIKISAAHKGKCVSPKTRAILSEKNTGAKCGFFKGNIEVYSKSGELVGMYEGSGDCARQLNLNESHISSCIRGARKQHKGYTFRRI